jgi:3,4-dihydroxy 2-butanone 4-phosphate synthase/GTP cyclohydrolase II
MQSIRTMRTTQHSYTEVHDAIADFAKGAMLLVSDDEDRENEGDLIIAAEFATPEVMNFMITYGKGLVCLAIAPEIARQKALRPMVENNEDHHGTAFTLSVDGALEHGITTGISASERAKTVQMVIDDSYGPEDIRSPGHMFPLVARDGGLRVRQGHTEAGVELARLAGLKPAAVIVEVIRDDGEMARRPDIEKFAERHGLQFITIKDLINYMDHYDTVPMGSGKSTAALQSVN